MWACRWVGASDAGGLWGEAQDAQDVEDDVVGVAVEEVVADRGVIEEVAGSDEEFEPVGSLALGPDEPIEGGVDLGSAAGDGGGSGLIGGAGLVDEGLAAVALQLGLEGEGLSHGAREGVEGQGEALGVLDPFGVHGGGVQLAGEVQAHLAQLPEAAGMPLGHLVQVPVACFTHEQNKNTSNGNRQGNSRRGPWRPADAARR